MAKYYGHYFTLYLSMSTRKALIVVIVVKGRKRALSSMNKKFLFSIAAYRSDFVFQSSIITIMSMNNGINIRFTNIAAKELR